MNQSTIKSVFTQAELAERSITPKKLFDTGRIPVVCIWLTTVTVSAFFPPACDPTADIAIFSIESVTLSVFLTQLLHFRSRYTAPGLLRTRSTLPIVILHQARTLTIELLRISLTDNNLAHTGADKNHRRIQIFC